MPTGWASIDIPGFATILSLMRVSGGVGKGRRLRYPARGLRPTKSVVRQAVMNVLRGRLSGARVADLYAGGGALGIEALSAGAERVVFVERHRPTARLLRENVASYGARAEVLIRDVDRAFARRPGPCFDIVIADPPYEQGLDRTTLEAVMRDELLVDGGVLVLEHSRRDRPEPPAGLEFLGRHQFGDTIVSLFQRRGRATGTGRGGRAEHAEQTT
jgi:16S rRNA (guanine966-N2)-methyltransferase